jgi:hypothetical protein
MPAVRGNINASIGEAKARAKATGESWFVIALDDGAGRRRAICREGYLDSDEFEAFDGRIVYEVFPDGTYE